MTKYRIPVCNRIKGVGVLWLDSYIDCLTTRNSVVQLRESSELLRIELLDKNLAKQLLTQLSKTYD